MVRYIILIVLFGVVVGNVYGQYDNEYYDNERVNFDISVATGAGEHGCEDTVRGCFIPKYSTVHVGQKVVFVNTDKMVHSFTAGVTPRDSSSMFDSGLVTTGGSYEWVPLITGVFPYHCTVHPWMSGVITVEGITEYENNLKVVFINLNEKGESILVQYPNGKNLLIDGGMQTSYQKLESVLKKYNVVDIDVMIGTHADQDHVAGLSRILGDIDFKVHKVLISDVQSGTETYESFITEITENGLEPQVVFDGYDLDIDKSIMTEIISPSPNGLTDGTDATLSNTNALVTWLAYNNISFLFTSDASFLTEKYIIENHPVDIDIMSSPHHGSKFSSTDKFLNMATPQLIIVSADPDNQYGHPDKIIITRYDSRAISHYQTGIDGTIEVRTDGVGCSIVFEDGSELPCYDNVHQVLEYDNSGVPFCKTRALDIDEEDDDTDCSGWLHVVRHGYYDYGTGEVKSIIDPYGDGTGAVSQSKGLSRSIWLVEEWVVNLQDWYDQGLITSDNFDSALQYLIDKGIAKYQKI